MTKNIKFVITRFVFFHAQNEPKSVFGWGSARTPLGELTTLPQTPQSAGEGIPPPHSPPHSTPSASRRLGSKAPSTQNPGYASGTQPTCVSVLALVILTRPQLSCKAKVKVTVGASHHWLEYTFNQSINQSQSVTP